MTEDKRKKNQLQRWLLSCKQSADTMRLTCDIDVVNRTLATHNLKKVGKSCRAQLSIGKKPGSGSMKDGSLYLMLCTAKDRNGAKYAIKDNIQQVFTKFVSEGKATIRIKDPEQDICISKADVIQLKSFLNVLRLALQGKNLENVTLSSLAPASAKNVEKPKTNLVILSRKEYPLTSNFPGSLESLQVSECRMKRIDSRIFKLRHLMKLDLSNNLLENVPDEISQLTNLTELRLASNNLTTFSPTVCLKETLQRSLKVLDLSDNKIEILPLQICELQSLLSLKLDNNQMEYLPPTLGRLCKLNVMSVSNNKVKYLPASFMRLRLENIDLFGNPFDMTADCQVSGTNVDVPSLMECASRSIKKYKISYSPDDLHLHLCRYLDSARQCWCGSYCFQSSVRYTTKVDLRRISSTVTAVDVTGGTGVPVEGFLCSPQCLNKFRNNPNAYWR